MSFQSLQLRSGSDWLRWLKAASVYIPELSRAFQCLEVLCEAQDSIRNHQGYDPKVVRKTIQKHLGQTKCPSGTMCEKLTTRAQILLAWCECSLGEADHFPPLSKDIEFALEVLTCTLERLIPLCEGADDKAGTLQQSARQTTRYWLTKVSQCVEDPIERAHLIYPVALLDQAAVIQPDWWWRALSQCDVGTVLALADSEVEQLSVLHPSHSMNWKSYDQRWRRLRLKSLLSFLGEKRILSELLRKSAVDDFEGAQALSLMKEAGRQREAVVQGEEWMRRLPRSSVLALALFELYVADGWDDEAIALLQSQYAMDPDPRWKALLKEHFQRDEFPGNTPPVD